VLFGFLGAASWLDLPAEQLDLFHGRAPQLERDHASARLAGRPEHGERVMLHRRPQADGSYHGSSREGALRVMMLEWP